MSVLTAKKLGRVRNVEAALAKHGDRINLYVEAMMWGDPLADAFAADCAEIGRGVAMNMYERVVVDQVDVDSIPDAPDSLKALATQLNEVPFWADLDEIDMGAAAYSRNAREAGIALGTASLISGYSNAAAVAPLAVTRRFVDQAKLRSLETSRWVFATARPGGLHRGGEGFARTARVRMIHAFVRRHILTKVAWDINDLGVPINQADLAYTGVEFSLLPIRAMERLGVHFRPSEVSAMFALWRYMGYLIGLDERVLPTSRAEAERLADMQSMVSPPPDDYCREFVTALLDDVLAVDIQQATGLLGVVGRRNGRSLLHGLARDFVGDEIADGLDIEDTVWKYTPKITHPFLAVSSRLQALSPAWQQRRMMKSLAEVDEVLDDTALRMGVTHDLVDQAPGHPASR